MTEPYMRDLRDKIALTVLQTALTCIGNNPGDNNLMLQEQQALLARVAYGYADAMLDARKLPND